MSFQEQKSENLGASCQIELDLDAVFMDFKLDRMCIRIKKNQGCGKGLKGRELEHPIL